jgi:hypothetical protein
MTFPSDDDLVKKFAEHGIRATTPADWSQQMAFDAIRENRRRYAHTPRAASYGRTAAFLVEAMSDVCDVEAADMASVLITTSALVGTVTLLSSKMTALDLAQILAFAADDLNRAANGGEQP